MNIVNISGYKFINLAAKYLPSLQQQLKDNAQRLGVKGSILLSPEGINLFWRRSLKRSNLSPLS